MIHGISLPERRQTMITVPAKTQTASIAGHKPLLLTTK